MNYRPLRISNLIHEELSTIIEREIELESGVLATITGVNVDKKMEHAVVKLSILPQDSAQSSFEIFKKAERHLQFLLMKKLNIKPMPHIEFKLDYGSEHAARIEKLLIESEDK